MALASLAVENYRGFVELTHIELRPLTLAFGYNSAGKSALLRTLPLLADSVQQDAVGPLNLHSPAIRGATFQEIRSQYTDHPFIRFALGWDDDASPVRKVVFTVRDLSDRRRQIVEKFEIWGTGNTPEVLAQWKLSSAERGVLDSSADYEIKWAGQEIDVTLDMQGLCPVAVDASGIPDALRSLLRGLAERLLRVRSGVHWIGSWRTSPERNRKYTGRPNRIEPDGAGAEDILAYDQLDNGPLGVEVSEWYQAATNYRLEVQRDARGVSGHFSIALSPVDASRLVQVHISDTGEGMAQVLPVLVLGALACHGKLGNGSVLALEHPALHLHPAAHEHLAAFFCKVATSRSGPRLLVETHSENLLLRVQLEIVEGRLPADQVLVYWIRQARDGRGEIERITFNELGEPQGPWPPEVFSEDIAQARKIIMARRKRRQA